MKPRSSQKKNLILSRIRPTYHIDAYFFKIQSKVVLPKRLGLRSDLPPAALPIKILKHPIFITFPIHLIVIASSEVKRV